MRQLATKSTSWPMDGARMGTSMKTVMTKDMTRAMAAPPCPSRTMAIETMRGAAAPKPWTTRPSSMHLEARLRTGTCSEPAA